MSADSAGRPTDGAECLSVNRGLTSIRRALDPAEWATTALATVVSTLLYLRHGHPYLARGVVGDLVGFAVLSGILAVRRRRARHEATVCLAAIGAVWCLHPDWPLRLHSTFWWAAVALGFGAYLTVRQRRLP